MSTATPPGWYPDPERAGAQRWWDGNAWTTHTAEAAGPVAQGSAGGANGVATTSQSRNWAMWAHLSAFVAMFLAMAFLGPLVVYIVKKDEDPFVRAHAAEALNFQLSTLLYAVVGGTILVILIVFLVGLLLIPVAIALAVGWFVVIIVAAVRAGRGEFYRYPLTIRLIT